MHNSVDLCNRTSCELFLSSQIFSIGTLYLGDNFSPYQKPMLGGTFVKVVVMKSPKFLGSILRMIFGIKKQTENT